MKMTQMYSGDERFTDGFAALPFSIFDFWRWSSSNLLDNTLRGLLAEYLVAVAIHAEEQVRREWSAWDLTAPSGARIEVKSAAYLQSWKQKSPSVIRFGIQSTKGWDAQAGEYETESRRQADYYVFCLFTHRDRETADPMRLDQWTFYVLSSDILNRHCPKQKSIGLARVTALEARKCTWAELCKYPFEA